MGMGIEHPSAVIRCAHNLAWQLGKSYCGLEKVGNEEKEIPAQAEHTEKTETSIVHAQDLCPSSMGYASRVASRKMHCCQALA